MDKAFTSIIRRAKALRKTEADIYVGANVSASRYSRAKSGKSGDRARFSVINQIEDYLDFCEHASRKPRK